MLGRHDPTPGDRKQVSRVGESGQALLQSVPRPPFWHRQTRHPTTQLRQAASFWILKSDIGLVPIVIPGSHTHVRDGVLPSIKGLVDVVMKPIVPLLIAAVLGIACDPAATRARPPGPGQSPRDIRTEDGTIRVAVIARDL